MTKMTYKTIELYGVKYQLVPFDDTTREKSLHVVIHEWVEDQNGPLISELVDRIERWLPEGTGEKFNFQGSLPAASSLPPSSKIGNAYEINETKELYVYDGIAWVITSLSSGWDDGYNTYRSNLIKKFR